MRAALLMAAALLVLSACAPGDPEGATPSTSPGRTDAAQPTPRPTATPPPSPGRGDTITGTLGADTAERGCAYLQAADGTRYEVRYPEGWTLQAAPLRLTNPDREVMATGGETITVRGRLAREMRSICQLGPIFEAVEVVSVD